jgi:hypothetical protein
VIGTRRFWFWLIALLIAAMVLAVAFWLDPVVQSWIVEHQNRQLRDVMQQVSRYGDWPTHVVLGLLLLAIAWWRKSKKWLRVFLAMLVACALAGAAARVIKVTTGRATLSEKLSRPGPRSGLSAKHHAFLSGTLRHRPLSLFYSSSVGESVSHAWLSRY